ncbi:hypothetical protein [Caballeronia telluris]|uniref:Uncharacterized protein n=1 Tax=Caballeronia telluris TaxID=326475 RepID=A0A158KB09_9BURK|nr:hypothetical protein [Caballeronia telluris]SAL78205.1 hypothetical protein AWB66_05790 [Caballeronia telluris]
MNDWGGLRDPASMVARRRIRVQEVIVIKNIATALLLAAAPLLALAGTPTLHSRSALVYDIRHQEVLLEKNADTVRPVASPP